MAKKDSAGSIVFLGLLGTGIGVLAVDYAFSDTGLSMVERLLSLIGGALPTPSLPEGRTHKSIATPEQPPDWLRQGLPGWALPEAPAPKAPLYPAAGFDQGLVREAQQRLDALNLPQLKTRLDALGAPSIPSWVPLPLKVDGLLGDKTKAVLKALQGAMGVPATGLPDDATMGLLRNPGVLDALKRAIGETGKPTLPTPGPRKQTTVQSSSAPAISVPLSQQAAPPVTYTPFPMPQLQAQASTPGSGPGTRPFPSMQQPMPQPQQLPQQGQGQGFGIPGLGSVAPAPWLLELGQELGLVRTGASAAPAPGGGVIALPAPLPAALAQETAQLGPSAQAVLQRALSSETDQATLLDLAGKLAASNMPKTAQALAAKVSWSATRVGFGGRAPWQSPWLPGEPQAIGWW